MHSAPRLGTTVSDATVAASTTFTLAVDTEYRLATASQAIICKFGAGPVTAADADAFIVDPASPLCFNSGPNTQLSVIEKAASAVVSLTKILPWGKL